MKLTLDGNDLLVEKEPTDKKLYKESTFFYLLKKALQERGLDCIYKLAARDGHMTDGYYIRDRKWEWCLVDGFYAIRQIFTPFNQGASVRLMIYNWSKHCPLWEASK